MVESEPTFRAALILVALDVVFVWLAYRETKNGRSRELAFWLWFIVVMDTFGLITLVSTQ